MIHVRAGGYLVVDLFTLFGLLKANTADKKMLLKQAAVVSHRLVL